MQSDRTDREPTDSGAPNREPTDPGTPGREPTDPGTPDREPTDPDEGDVASYLHTMFDDLFEGIQILDRDWRYVYVNQTAAEHGRQPREALVGQSMLEVYPGIERSEMFQRLETCMTERVPQQMLNRFGYPDGEQRWFELRMNPVPDGVMILSVDVTARERVEEQLRQSQKMDAIGRLAGGVAHDFNNLLSVITSYADLILGKMPEDERFRRELEQIRKAGEHAAALTRQLLAFSRKRVLQPEVVDLNGVVRQMSKMLRRVIGEPIELVTSLGSDLDLVRFDPGQIEQILMNLAVNARDAMPDGGTLTVETANVELDEEYARAHADASPGPHVMIAVTDTGSGIDPAIQDRVFEPFFTTKERGKGTGLGLATIYGIVKQSGGHIWLYSKPGWGTTFKVYLPRAEDDDASTPDRPTAASPPATGTETVLVVEDDPAVRDVIRRVLENGGYTILDAATPEHALNIVRSHDGPIHVLLTDLVLKGMNGRELADTAIEERPGIRVAFVSGYTDDAVARSGVIDRDTPFIEKPFTADTLLTTIRETLG